MKTMRVGVVALVAWVCACATNPATGRRQLILMSEQEEIAIGKQTHAEIQKQMGVYNDQALQQYVSQIGRQLAQQAYRKNLPWTFTVVDEAAVNAFALPGGFIYITRGILPFMRNEAELAGVLGHEIGHVDARHAAEQYSKQLTAGGLLTVGSILAPSTQPLLGAASVGLQFLFLKYGREAELESDRLGVGYSARSGWDPNGVPGMLGTLGRLDEASGTRRGIPNWALTHPPAADRVKLVQEAVAAAPATGKRTDAQEFERRLDGLVFGDSREKGIVRGSTFVHPILRFSVEFPEGWEVRNSDDQVSATPGEEANAAMILELAPGNGPVEQVGPAQMAAAGWKQTAGQRTNINGLNAYLGLYQGTSQGRSLTMQAAHVRAADQTYVIAGIAPTNQFSDVDDVFTRSIRTFQRISQQEADRIQPSRVDFYTVRPGDTWDSIAKSVGGGTIRGTTLAIMNGAEPSTAPRSGSRVRVVVAG
jgi:predicted Zn-dependent protease